MSGLESLLAGWGVGEWFVLLTFVVPTVVLTFAITIRWCIDILRGR